MRTHARWLGTLAVLALAAGTARAQDDPKAVIAQAIKAHGGEDKLTRLKASRMKAKGTIVLSGVPTPLTVDAVSQQRGQMRTEIKMEFMGQSYVMVQAVNKDVVWKTVNGQTAPLDDAERQGLKDETYNDYLQSLVPLLKDKDFKLESAGETKVEGKPAVGVKVSSMGHQDVTLFFDKDTHLMVKTLSRAKDETMKDVEVESFLSGYKDVDGVQTPMKVLVNRGGKKFIDLDVIETKLLEKVDDSTFDKPKE